MQLGRRGERGGDQARPARAARRATSSFSKGAFHGRTYGALSATPQETKQAPFAPLVPGFVVVPKDPGALYGAVDDRTAAVLLEPIQGETGIHVLSDDLLLAAREACDRTGAALIFDEIQTGMGRTGTLWAYEQTDVVPDAITSAKALGGGLPIGALITGPRLARRAPARRPRLDVRRRPGGVVRGARRARDLLGSGAARARAGRRRSGLRRGLRRCRTSRAVRGRGLMLAIDVDPEIDAAELARRALLEQRLVVNATGPATIRLEPPLIVSDDEIDEAVARLEALAP